MIVKFKLLTPAIFLTTQVARKKLFRLNQASPKATTWQGAEGVRRAPVTLQANCVMTQCAWHNVCLGTIGLLPYRQTFSEIYSIFTITYKKKYILRVIGTALALMIS